MVKRVRGSRTGRPIMVLLDLLGRRWALRILWELRGGALTSRALRTACDEYKILTQVEHSLGPP